MKLAIRTSLMLILLVFLLVNDTNAQVLQSYDHLKPIRPINWVLEDGSLILSNSPETISKPGILYEGQIIGKGRIVYHHVNATDSQAVQLVIWLKNNEESSSVITIGAKGNRGPEYHYLKAGEMALSDFFMSHDQFTFILQPGEKKLLYRSPDSGWPLGSLMTGLIDLSASSRITVGIALQYMGEPVEEGIRMPFLEKDIEERGKFNTLTIRQYVILPEKGKFYYLIEEKKEDWQRGKDEITGEYAMNYGNYGIMYKITVYASEETKVFICPRGGIFQGVIFWEDGRIFPVKRPHVFKLTKEVITIAKLAKGESSTFEYMLPNGSAAPVLIGFEMND